MFGGGKKNGTKKRGELIFDPAGGEKKGRKIPPRLLSTRKKKERGMTEGKKAALTFSEG